MAVHSDNKVDWYLGEIMSQVPRILTLVDRDPSSPTYGCFDRSYWHYRTADFPSGMYQELALVLAQAYRLQARENPWYGQPRVRALALAAVDFAARSAHADGSCDDYYPNERALGATAFAAAACIQTLYLLNEGSGDRLAFLQRRLRWLQDHQETGRLSNHQALVALAGTRMYRLTGESDWLQAAQQRLAVCLAWQHPEEGWFTEYEGADPSYQTLTLAFLAEIQQYLPSLRLGESLERGVRFAAHFLHPDGSFGGETGSRNNCQVLPSGFERLAQAVPAASYLAEGWLEGARAGLLGYPHDDRILCHWLQDYWEARRARQSRGKLTAPPAWRPATGRTDFQAAGLHLIRDADLHLVISTQKGGVCRAYLGKRLLRNDTGLVALDCNGRRLATHVVWPNCEAVWGPRDLTVRCPFHYVPRRLPSPLTQMAFRLVNSSIGRLAPNLLRWSLQKLLITGKLRAPYQFRRRIEWEPTGRVTIRDTVLAEPGAPRLAALYASTDATSIYVATSNLWQQAGLQSWDALDSAREDLNATDRCEIFRSYS